LKLLYNAMCYGSERIKVFLLFEGNTATGQTYTYRVISQNWEDLFYRTDVSRVINSTHIQYLHDTK